MESEKFIINKVDLEDIIADINLVTNNLFRYRDNEGKLIVLVAEREYFRIESNLAATIIIDPIDENHYQIVIVVAGGRHGLFGLTWGAERSMLKRIKNVFLKYVKIS
ncbi:MAG: hypothetical protein ACFFDF_03530 [Candidatus Odinarchaeota archaeon]